MVSPAEQRLLLEGVQGPLREAHLAAPLLHEQFAAAAVRHGQAPAVIQPGCPTLSFGQLAAVAARLAHLLAAAALPASAPVGLLLDRTPEWVAAMLACLVSPCVPWMPAPCACAGAGDRLAALVCSAPQPARAPLLPCLPAQASGHPFVPMEPSLPVGRLAWYAQDARPALLLTAAGAAAQEQAQALLAAAGAEAAKGVRAIQVGGQATHACLPPASQGGLACITPHVLRCANSPALLHAPAASGRLRPAGCRGGRAGCVQQRMGSGGALHTRQHRLHPVHVGQHGPAQGRGGDARRAAGLSGGVPGRV